MRCQSRCARNRFAFGDAPEEVDAQKIWSQVLQLIPELDECATRGAVPDSRGRWKGNYTVYTGLGGIALTQLRIGLHCRDIRNDASIASDYINKARATSEMCLRCDSRSREVSFFCGTPGYLAIAAVASHILGDTAASALHLRNLLQWASAAARHAEDELLFGRAGYLYAVLWVRSYLGPAVADFDTALKQTAERLVETGKSLAAHRRYAGWPLMWHCFDEPYLGAAHGHVGILAMLIRCGDYLRPQSWQLVQATFEKLMSIRFRSGNLPIILGERSDDQVHWCHGAAGLTALAAVALERQLGDSSVLSGIAESAGEVIWERGVILKGNGLCHGIAGNGYTFLSLYRLTGKADYQQRAAAFAQLLFDADVQQAILQQPDPQRAVPGVPDSPRSLMEGSAGVVCFLLDVSSPAGSAFPAWEFEAAA